MIDEKNSLAVFKLSGAIRYSQDRRREVDHGPDGWLGQAASQSSRCGRKGRVVCKTMKGKRKKKTEKGKTTARAATASTTITVMMKNMTDLARAFFSGPAHTHA